MKVVLTTFNSKYIHTSLALNSISAQLAKQGKQAKIVEFTLQTPLLSALGQIFAYSPKVVGLAVHIWNRQLSFSLARLIKKVLPETILVLGGPEVSSSVEQVFQELPEADFLVQGEGEESFAALVDCLAEGETFPSIPGVAYRNLQGELVLNGGLQIVADLTMLEFPYNLTKGDWQNKIIYYESSRGCPFGCSYCLSSTSKNVRYRPLEKVFVDLKKLIEAGVKQVKFVDRTYNLNKSHYFPLMKWLAKQKCQTNFHFEIKADNLEDEVLAFLQSVPVGLFQFEIGVQSTNQKTLLASGRSQNWEKLVHNVRILKSFGNIHLHLDLIAGLPYETIELFKQSFNDVYNLQPDKLQLGFLKLLPGSLLEKEVHRYGYVFMPEPPYEILFNNYVSYQELSQLKLVEEVLELTYNTGRFASTLKYITEELYQKDAYAFYEKLAAWWERNNLFLFMHKPANIANYLHDFFAEKFTCYYKEILDCLKLDFILFHENSFRPSYIDWLRTNQGSEFENFWHQTKVVKKYLPDYSFSSWRELKNNYQIEVFTSYFAGAKLVDPVVVLFLKKSGKWQIIETQDFFAKKL